MTGVWLSPYPLDLGGDDSSVTMTPHCLPLTRCLRAHVPVCTAWTGTWSPKRA